MNDFKKYSSNTYAGTSNSFILARDGEIQPEKRARLFYRVTKSGKFGYKFCFSNAVDSTYEDGSRCVANALGGEWKILSMKAGAGKEYGDLSQDIELFDVTFDGEKVKSPEVGEVFWSDEIILDIPENKYLCVEITFEGSKIPYTPDKIIPAFSFDGEKWNEDKECPNPVIVGCDRPVKERIGFLGDSITQGLGTNADLYEHWVAETGRGLGADYSICNFGLGCARAFDAASDKLWLKRAKQMDTVFVCFGVNDIFEPRTAEEIGGDIEKIVDSLHDAGCKVGLLTTPPFDFTGDFGVTWYSLCDYLRTVVSKKCEYFFETSDYIGHTPPNRHMAKYNGHPDKRGGKALGQALGKYLKENGYGI